jgi:hypothetical protein
VRQPANAASGAAFLIVAVLVFNTARTSNTPVYSKLFAIAVALVGVGTIFYHASLTFVGQTMDVLGMYLVATYVVLYNSARIRPMSAKAMSTAYIAGNAVLLSGLVLLPTARRYVFAALILLAIALEIMARRDPAATRGEGRLFGAALLVLLVGFGIWILDITRAVCAPHSWLQGHAIWHIAGAISTWLIFRYLETTPPRNAQH